MPSVLVNKKTHLCLVIKHCTYLIWILNTPKALLTSQGEHPYEKDGLLVVVTFGGKMVLVPFVVPKGPQWELSWYVLVYSKQLVLHWIEIYMAVLSKTLWVEGIQSNYNGIWNLSTSLGSFLNFLWSCPSFLCRISSQFDHHLQMKTYTLQKNVFT